MELPILKTQKNLRPLSMPFMFFFMGLTLLTHAKECYDKGSKRDAVIFIGVVIFVYVITAYNLISKTF